MTDFSAFHAHCEFISTYFNEIDNPPRYLVTQANAVKLMDKDAVKGLEMFVEGLREEAEYIIMTMRRK
jgi:hypothetical protein